MSSYLSSYNLVRASNRRARALLRHRKTPAKVAISTTFPLYLSPSLSVSLLLRYFRLLSVALTDTSRAPEHSFTNIIMPDSQSVRHRERERERERERQTESALTARHYSPYYFLPRSCPEPETCEIPISSPSQLPNKFHVGGLPIAGIGMPKFLGGFSFSYPPRPFCPLCLMPLPSFLLSDFCGNFLAD